MLRILVTCTCKLHNVLPSLSFLTLKTQVFYMNTKDNLGDVHYSDILQDSMRFELYSGRVITYTTLGRLPCKSIAIGRGYV